jgi:hypothetical protein
MFVKRPSPGQIDLSGGVPKVNALEFVVDRDEKRYILDCMQADFRLVIIRHGRLWLCQGSYRAGDVRCLTFGRGKTKQAALDAALSRSAMKFQLEAHGLPTSGVLS